jgi:hypothetical protein
MTKKFTIQVGVFVFFIIFLLVSLVSLFKYINKTPDYFYAKVLVKKAAKDNPYPDFNYTKLIKKDDKIKDFMGNTEVEVLSVRYYYNNSGDNLNTYKIFLYLKIKKDNNKQTDFIYHKTKIKVGKIIDLDFDKVTVAGEILKIDNKPIQEKYVERIITLWRYEGQSQNNPNVFENIKIGESYFDGEDKVFVVLSKELVDLQMTGANASYFHQRGNMKHILITAKVKLLEEGDLLFFPDGQPVRFRQGLNIFTDHNLFDWYLVVGIE